MQPIIDTLPYGEVIVWDNSKYEDFRVWGRYRATADIKNEICYWQDDDVIFTEHKALLEAYEPGVFVSNNAHGPNHGGYDDLALQAAGALCDGPLVAETWRRWFEVFDPVGFHARVRDEDVYEMTGGIIQTFNHAMMLEADFIFGVLCPSWKQIDLPYTRLYADDNTRLCRQPWQEDLKLYMTNLAREIRDAR
jgi:hypothetical protein